MTTNLAIAAAMVASIATMPAIALAQPLPSVPDVQTAVQAACLTEPVNNDLCLVVVADAIEMLKGYLDTPPIPTLVGIGNSVCEVMVARPSLAPDIVAMINEARSYYLALGCINALGADWEGPRPLPNPE